MPMVIVGVLLLVAWLGDFGPLGALPWWVVALPFAAAVAWWIFADNSGWTQRRAMDKMERRKTERRERALDALGLRSRREGHVTRARQDAARRNTADIAGDERGDASSTREPRL